MFGKIGEHTLHVPDLELSQGVTRGEQGEWGRVSHITWSFLKYFFHTYEQICIFTEQSLLWTQRFVIREVEWVGEAGTSDEDVLSD